MHPEECAEQLSQCHVVIVAAAELSGLSQMPTSFYTDDLNHGSVGNIPRTARSSKNGKQGKNALDIIFIRSQHYCLT